MDELVEAIVCPATGIWRLEAQEGGDGAQVPAHFR